MNIQQTIIIGVISSVIASVVFYLLMIGIKPRFIISDKMSMTPKDDGTVDYMVKVINKTRGYITNISYSLLYCVDRKDEIIDMEAVNPLKPSLLYMDAFTKKNKDYAVRITFNASKDECKIDDNSYFLFSFQANHSFSNSMKIKTKKYTKNELMDGIFETGEGMNVLSKK